VSWLRRRRRPVPEQPRPITDLAPTHARIKAARIKAQTAFNEALGLNERQADE
jgi:hypothetical protein